MAATEDKNLDQKDIDILLGSYSDAVIVIFVILVILYIKITAAYSIFQNSLKLLFSQDLFSSSLA